MMLTVVSCRVISDAILNCFGIPPLASRLAGGAAIGASMKGKNQGKASGKASTSQRVSCTAIVQMQRFCRSNVPSMGL